MRRLCDFSDALTGSWLPLSARQQALWREGEPPCCSWDTDDNASPLCPDGQDAVRSAFETGRTPFSASRTRLAPVGARACSCARSRDALLAYRWVPSRCRLREFDAAAFCRLLGSRRILFVGDSTMQQTANAVMGQVVWDLGRLNSTAGCESQLFFGLSDTLVQTAGWRHGAPASRLEPPPSACCVMLS